MNDDTDPQPCCVALLAGTLTLMTAFADEPEPGASVDGATQRRLMARKITSNLFFLSQHPELPPAFRTIVARLQARWADRATTAAPAASRIDDDRAGAGRLH